MIQVELHDRSNNLVQILSGAKNAAYQQVLNQDGVGTFQIHRADSDAVSLNILQGGINGYIVHLLRKGVYETTFNDRFAFRVEAVTGGLDQQEEAGAWITVSGRGTLCLLEGRSCWPPGFDGSTAASITNQLGQVYAGVTGGQIMGGEIARSASRFTPALTHSVDTTTVPQTAKLRFDDLRKVHDYLVGNGMDAQMVGLDYQAADNLGSDKSATVTVQLGPQDSLLDVKVEIDSRPVTNYVIAQGTGEGINAPIATAIDATSVTKYGRREGFLPARQTSDQTQLALQASSAVKQLKDADQRITVKFTDSPHTQLYRDFGLGDFVTLAVAPLSWTAKYRVIGFSVADTDAEIEEIHLDLNSLRREYLLKLATGAQLTADGLRVLNVQPQGAPFNDSIGYPREADATHPFRFKFMVPSNVIKLNYAKLSIGLEAFRSPVASVNTATSGASSSSSSGASSASSSATGSGDHTHTWPIGNAGNGLWPIYWNSIDGVHTNAGSSGSLQTTTADTGIAHTHTIAHTHNIDHTHTVTPTLAYGIFEGAVATGVSVKVNGVDRTSALGGPFTVDQAELEIAQWLNVGAWNTVELTPTGLGTIIGHLRLTGYQQSV